MNDLRLVLYFWLFWIALVFLAIAFSANTKYEKSKFIDDNVLEVPRNQMGPYEY